MAVAKAEKLLSDREVWDVEVKIAEACLANGGNLSKGEIDTLLY